MHRSNRQKNQYKYIVELNSTINELGIIDIYRLLHPTTAEYTLFSSLHEIVTKADHILCHKTHPNKFERIKITSCLLPNHNGIKLEISNRNIAEESPNTGRLNPHIGEKNLEKLKNILNKNKNTTYQDV